jgi:hypothetical protein
VYIGSAIYTAGTLDIMETFNVTQVEATLGLTIFVIGYGLGKSIFSTQFAASAFHCAISKARRFHHDEASLVDFTSRILTFIFSSVHTNVTIMKARWSWLP